MISPKKKCSQSLKIDRPYSHRRQQQVKVQEDRKEVCVSCGFVFEKYKEVKKQMQILKKEKQQIQDEVNLLLTNFSYVLQLAIDNIQSRVLTTSIKMQENQKKLIEKAVKQKQKGYNQIILSQNQTILHLKKIVSQYQKTNANSLKVVSTLDTFSNRSHISESKRLRRNSFDQHQNNFIYENQAISQLNVKKMNEIETKQQKKSGSILELRQRLHKLKQKFIIK